MSYRMRVWLGRAVLLIGLIVAWEGLTGGIGTAVLNPVLAGRPSLIVRDFLIYAASGLFFDTATTLLEALSGLAIGIALGLSFGMVFGVFPLVGDIFSPFLTALNSLPRPALAPIVILWLGLGMGSKVLLSASLVFFA